MLLAFFFFSDLVVWVFAGAKALEDIMFVWNVYLSVLMGQFKKENFFLI